MECDPILAPRAAEGTILLHAVRGFRAGGERVELRLLVAEMTAIPGGPTRRSDPNGSDTTKSALRAALPACCTERPLAAASLV